MRLQLIAAVLVSVAGTTAVRAETERDVEASVRVYADDDDVVVVSPGAVVRAPLGDSATGRASALVDIVSAASVDVVTQASPGRVEEQRVELGMGASWRPWRTHTGGLEVIVTGENDHASLQLSGAWRMELARRNTAVELGHTASAARVGSAMDPSFSRRRTEHRSTFGVAQLVDERTSADLIVEVARIAGYQANPYRQVRIVDDASPMVTLVDEVVPDRRLSLAAAVRGRRAIGDDQRYFVSAAYRIYRDDWGITSHTTTARLMKQARPWLLCGAQLRGYWQGPARFYRAHHEGAVPRWRTADRSLGGMHSALISVTCDVHSEQSADGVRVIVAMAGMGMWFADYPPQRRRLATLSTLSVALPF